jgi:hypothetical protein
VARLLARNAPLSAWGPHFPPEPRRPAAREPGVQQVARAELAVTPGEPVTVEMRSDVVRGRLLVRLRLTRGGTSPRCEVVRVPPPARLSPARFGDPPESSGRGWLGPGGLHDTFFHVVDAKAEVFLAEQQWRAPHGAPADALAWSWVLSFEPDPQD